MLCSGPFSEFNRFKRRTQFGSDKELPLITDKLINFRGRYFSPPWEGGGVNLGGKEWKKGRGNYFKKSFRVHFLVWRSIS